MLATKKPEWSPRKMKWGTHFYGRSLRSFIHKVSSHLSRHPLDSQLTFSIIIFEEKIVLFLGSSHRWKSVFVLSILQDKSIKSELPKIHVKSVKDPKKPHVWKHVLQANFNSLVHQHSHAGGGLWSGNGNRATGGSESNSKWKQRSSNRRRDQDLWKLKTFSMSNVQKILQDANITKTPSALTFPRKQVQVRQVSQSLPFSRAA